MNPTVYSCKESVISAHAHIDSRVNLGSPLSDQNITCPYHLAAEPLYSQTLPCTVSSIPRASACLLVCHERYLLRTIKGIQSSILSILKQV